MNILSLVSHVVLWAIALFAVFLMLGILRALSVLGWRVDQLEATTPSRIGRTGLKPGSKAPDFALPSADADIITLRAFAGRKVLLVFTQSGCAPCAQIVPELNRLARSGGSQVLVVNNGEREATRTWAQKLGAKFPVLAQDHFSISKQYEVFATPFAFLIDEQGVIASKGIINNRQHIQFVFENARDGAGSEHDKTDENKEMNRDENETQQMGRDSGHAHLAA